MLLESSFERIIVLSNTCGSYLEEDNLNCVHLKPTVQNLLLFLSFFVCQLKSSKTQVLNMHQ